MNHNDWLDIDILEDYLDGKLDAKSMHNVERLSLEDPFVAEALAGLSQSHKRTTSLSLLQKQLNERVSQKPIVEKRWRITSQRLSVAAAAAVLFVVVSILFWMKQPNKDSLAATKKVETTIAPQVADGSIPNKTSDLPIVAKIDNVPENLDKDKTTIAATEQVAKAMVAVESKQVASALPKAIDTAVRSSNAVSAVTSTDVVILARTKAPQTQGARETVLSGKAEGVQFTPTSIISQGKPGVLINGVVYEKPGGQPIPGAVVRIPGTTRSTTTNANGEFSISADSSSNSLSIAYLGFTSKEVQAKPNQSVSVALEHDQSSLNEIVVSNSDKAKPVKPTPEPVIGWAGFASYLAANNKLLPVDTKATKFVQLIFKVEKDGRPSAVKVKKGLTKVENDEAVRLITHGPDWKLPRNSRREVEVNVGF